MANVPWRKGLAALHGMVGSKNVLRSSASRPMGLQDRSMSLSICGRFG